MELYLWQKSVLDKLRNSESVSLNAPPGSGKTLPAVIYIKETIDALNDNEQIFWLVPYKALAFDKYNELASIFGNDKVGILTGDYKENVDAKIVVAIYESFYNRRENVNPKFIVIDESHTIGDRNNIHKTVEYIINSNIQYYAISGSFKNMPEIFHNSLYIEIEDNNKYTLPKEYYTIYRINDNNFLFRIIQQYKTLVFYFSIKKIRDEISKFIEFLKDKNIKQKIDDSIIESVNDELLREALRYNIAFYTSDLSNNDKAIILTLFDKGLINCIFCTDTISTGVNIPVDVIIMRDIKKYNDKTGKVEYLDENLLLQIYGRCGRRGKSRTAKIYLPINAPKYYIYPKQQDVHIA